MAAAAEKGNDHLGALKDEVAALRDKLEALLGDATGTNGKGEPGAALAELGRKGAERAKREIAQRPLFSVLLFFLIGLVLGRLILGWLAIERK